MLDAFLKYWVTWAFGIIAGALLFFRKKMVAWYKARLEKRAADEFADRYVLFTKLRDIYKEAQEQGYITIDDMDDAEQTYKHYHVLGGNGRATQMKQDMKRYNTIAELPSYAQATLIKMVDKGVIGGSGKAKDANGRPADLDLSMDMVRVFVTNDRAGLYD